MRQEDYRIQKRLEGGKQELGEVTQAKRIQVGDTLDNGGMHILSHRALEGAQQEINRGYLLKANLQKGQCIKKAKRITIFLLLGRLGYQMGAECCGQSRLGAERCGQSRLGGRALRLEQTWWSISPCDLFFTLWLNISMTINRRQSGVIGYNKWVQIFLSPAP